MSYQKSELLNLLELPMETLPSLKTVIVYLRQVSTLIWQV